MFNLRYSEIKPIVCIVTSYLAMLVTGMSLYRPRERCKCPTSVCDNDSMTYRCLTTLSCILYIFHSLNCLSYDFSGKDGNHLPRWGSHHHLCIYIYIYIYIHTYIYTRREILKNKVIQGEEFNMKESQCYNISVLSSNNTSLHLLLILMMVFWNRNVIPLTFFHFKFFTFFSTNCQDFFPLFTSIYIYIYALAHWSSG